MEEETLSPDEVHALNTAEEEALLADADSQDEDGTPQIEAEPDDTPKADPAPGPNEPPPANDKPKGDTRAALRAARRGEQRARAENERLRAENEALRAKTPAEPVSDDLAELEADFPAVGKAMKALRNDMQAIAATTKATTQPAQAETPEFEPPMLPPVLQAVVDEIPELSDWQNDPDQTSFDMAKAEDAKLLAHPKWKGASAADRLAEVVRRVKADPLFSGDAEPTHEETKPRVSAKDVIANAPRVKPNTLADIGGGGDTPKSVNNLGRYSQMSDEDIEADLLMGG